MALRKTGDPMVATRAALVRPSDADYSAKYCATETGVDLSHWRSPPEQRSTARHRIPPFESTPLVIDDVLYFSTPANRVIALDAGTGREIWKFDPQAGHSGPRHFHQHRGVAYWQNESGSERRIIFGTYDGRLIALDAKTGKPCSDFGNHGVVNLRDGR